MHLQLHDGEAAIVDMAGPVRHTQHPGIGFAADARADIGVLLDLRGEQVARVSGDLWRHIMGQPDQPHALDLGAPCLRKVYGLVVQGCHTCYVGGGGVGWGLQAGLGAEAGVWARDQSLGVGD